MLENRLFTIFPIYHSVTEQNRYKEGYAGAINDMSTELLVCSSFRLLPFQYRKPSTANTLTHLWLVNPFTEVYTNILPLIPAGQIDYETVEGYTYITYFGTADLTSELECGIYYLVTADADENRYSEVFKVEDWTVDATEYSEAMPGVQIQTTTGTNLIWK